MIGLLRFAPDSDFIRRSILVVFDSLSWLAVLGAATAVRLSLTGGRVDWSDLFALAAVSFAATIAMRQVHRVRPGRVRRGSLSDAKATAAVWAGVAAVLIVVNYYLLGRPVPTAAIIVALPLALLVQLSARLLWRAFYEQVRRPDLADGKLRVIVFGAGEGGEQIIRAMLRDPESDYYPVAVLDDHRTSSVIHGVPCRGTRADIADVAKQYDADLLLIAVPSGDAALVSELDAAGRDAGLDVRVLPSTSELLGLLQVDLGAIRELTDSHSLGRK